MPIIKCDTPEHMACLTVTTEVHLTEEFLRDVFTTAIEGGINYWARVVDYRWQDTNALRVRAVINDEQDDAKVYRITLDTIATGIERVLARPQLRLGLAAHIMVLDAGDIDADDADVIAQLGLFDQVVYG